MKKQAPFPAILAASFLALAAMTAPAAADTGPDGAPLTGSPPEVRLIIATAGPYVAPEPVLLAAAVADADGGVTRVEFFVGDTRIGVAEGDSRSMGPMNPFVVQWRNVLAGDHLLSARAIDDTGLAATSEPVKLHVEQADSAFIVINHPEPEAVFQGPARVVIEAIAVDPAADIRRVEFLANEVPIGVSEFLSKIAVIPGNPIPHHLVWEDVPAGDYLIQALAEDLSGNPVRSEAVAIRVQPAFAPTVVVLVPAGSEWRYWNRAEPPPGNWLADELDFPDWPVGPAQLGYGDGDEATITGDGGSPHPMTAYFRRYFEVPADLAALGLRVKLVRDDGAAVHLNGVELVRDNLPPGELTFDTPAVQAAGGEDETAWHTYAVPAEALRAGPNLVGVEVHQNSPMSSDSSFDLELAAIVDAPPGKPIVSIRATVPETTEPSPETRVQPGQFTIHRTGPVEEPLAVVCLLGGSASREADYHLDPAPGPMSMFTIPAGKEALQVWVGPVDDELVEGDETVVAELARMPLGAPEPWPGQPYEIDPNQARATVVIHDNDAPSAAGLVILHPPPGILWPAGETLPIDIVATDPHGYIARVEVFDGETRIGVSEIAFFVAPPPGTPIEHHVEWEHPPAGEHVLRAVAIDSAGEKVVSDPVPITVKPGHEQAMLEILHPPPGILWPAEATLPIDIVATDPHGYIPRVEVFAGETLIGVSEIFFFVAPPPGTPIDHHVEWENPPAGEHVLRAVAVNSAGDQVVSEPVPITVEPPFAQVVLRVTASHPATAEPGPLVDPIPAAFVIERVAGPTDVDVHVFYQLGGTATEGEDYRALPRDLVLRAGQGVVEIPLIALADNLTEGEESVVLELLPPACPAIYPPPPGCYRVGEPALAEIVIYDTPGEGNLPPQVAIAHPRNGAVVPPDEAVEVVVEAADHDGEVVHLALSVDGQEVAATAGARLVATWLPAGPGEHLLTAIATDDEGASAVSHPVKVFVRGTDILSFVRRDLPAGYLPGRAFEVVLEVLPPDHGIAWAVEDQPPSGWTVGEISHEGVFDPVTGKVKFGPFLAREPRRLIYLVRPPEDATGRHEFSGHGSVDGANHPITGDRFIELADHRHPADNTPLEMAMTVDEVTAYTAAWKQGHEWPLGPNPIPLAYVTKAGALWQHGEGYEYDPGLGAPPACWVSLPPPAAAQSQGFAGGDSSAGGERDLPDGCLPGQSLVARVNVRPPAETAAWAVEEEVPLGWQISGISHEGRFDPNTRRIRWGLFFGSEPTELSYHATAPGDVTSIGRFHGQVSFDGSVGPLVGGWEAVATDASTEVRFTRVDRDGDGPVRLRIHGGAGQLVVVECSNDLRRWKEIAPVGLVGGELEFEDLPEDGNAVRFYRARPIGP